MSGEGLRAPAVVAKDLRKLFAREGEAPAVALDSVSLEAAHGELTALVGPDGAGKTTLMRLAAGLLRADRGSIEVLGIDAGVDPQQIQDRISYMPQRFGLYEDLTVAENLELYANLHGVSKEERARRYPATHGHDRAWTLQDAPRRAAVGRYEAEARPRVHAGP